MRPTIVLALIVVTSIARIAPAQSVHQSDPSDQNKPADTAFASQMMQAMERMNSGMMAAKPTGDPDRDFAAMMIPHHQAPSYGKGGVDLRSRSYSASPR